MKQPPWLWCDDLAEPGLRALDREETRHLGGPLRRRAGDGVVLTDGFGRSARAVIVTIGSGRAEVEIESIELHERSPGHVEIALGVLHGQAMEWAVQKAVEVGVAVFRPVVCERCQIGTRTARSRLERWRRTAREACKQSHRPWLMDVAEPLELEGLCGEWHDRALLADQDGTAVASLPADAARRMLVGPEGGLAASEREQLVARGWVPVALGPHVLRAETAVVVGGACLVGLGARRE